MKYFKSKISGTIPEIAYFLSFNLMFSLIRLGEKSPNLGLILIKTFPYCGGLSSLHQKQRLTQFRDKSSKELRDS